MHIKRTAIRGIGAMLLGLIAASCAAATEHPLDIKTDLKGKFYLVEKSGTPDNPVLVVRLDSPGGTFYTKRLFDCKARTARLLAAGNSLQSLTQAKPDPQRVAKPVQKGSINEQLWQRVCGK